MMNMTNIIEKIQDQIPGCTTEIKLLYKNNNVEKTGVVIKDPHRNYTPIIYIDNFIDNMSEDELVDEVVSTYNKNSELPFDISVFDNYELIKDKLDLILVDADSNSVIKEKYITKSFLDLLIVVVVNLDNADSESGIVKITPEIAGLWNMTPNEVIEQAYINLIHNSYYLKPIESIIPPGLIDLPEMELNLYILTKETKTYGASKMLDIRVLDMLSEKFDSDLAIIPSSIHEVLIIPYVNNSYNDLVTIINDVNTNIVDDTDILSNHPYIYSRKEGWSY